MSLSWESRYRMSREGYDIWTLGVRPDTMVPRTWFLVHPSRYPRGEAHLTMFEFGGHANLAGLSLLDIRASLDSPIYFPEWPTIEICCIFVPKSVQICLQSSKIRLPNSNLDKCVTGEALQKETQQ